MELGGDQVQEPPSGVGGSGSAIAGSLCEEPGDLAALLAVVCGGRGVRRGSDKVSGQLIYKVVGEEPSQREEERGQGGVGIQIEAS